MSFIKTPQNIWLKFTFILLASFLALLFGLISVTANPIFIGLAAGLVAGIFLLAIPKKTIWLVIVFGLATPALLDIAGHGLSRMLWAISMLGLLLWIPSLFNLLEFNRAPNQNKEKNIPLFVWVALLFAIFSVGNTILQLHSIGQFFGGFKRYFQAFGLMLALATLVITRKEFDTWLKLLLGIAILQLPFALFERFVLVPLRGGVDLGGGQATDIVAGTMGANLDGGSPNSVMVTFILIAFAFVFSRWKVGLLEKSQMMLFSFLLLLPLVLGETKIVIVMLPLLAVVLLRKDVRAQPSKYLPILAAMFLLTLFFTYVYVRLMLNSTFSDMVTGVISYNIQDVGYGSLLLNRTTVMSFWWELHGWFDPIPFLFGHGLGSSYGSGFEAGHVAQLYPNYGINITALSSILWDLGFIGFLLYVSIFIIAWFQIGKVWHATTSVKIKADCVSLQVGIALTMMFLVYSDSQVNLLVHEIIIAVMLGYAAYLHKEQKREVI